MGDGIIQLFAPERHWFPLCSGVVDARTILDLGVCVAVVTMSSPYEPSSHIKVISLHPRRNLQPLGTWALCFTWHEVRIRLQKDNSGVKGKHGKNSKKPMSSHKENNELKNKGTIIQSMLGWGMPNFYLRRWLLCLLSMTVSSLPIRFGASRVVLWTPAASCMVWATDVWMRTWRYFVGGLC